MKPTVDQLGVLVQHGPNEHTSEELQSALDIATALVAGYTRGGHALASGELKPGISEVVLSVAARFIANPAGIQWRNQAGDFSELRTSGLNGFTLAERAVMNRYRKQSV